MKFKDMPYKRAGLEEYQGLFRNLTGRMTSAASQEEAFKAMEEFDGACERLSTMDALAFIRNSIDTTDEFYDREKAYYDEAMPTLQEDIQKFSIALLDSPYRPQMEEKWGKLIFLRTEMELKCFSPEIIPDLQEENRLTTEYDKLIASAQIEYDGKTLTLSQLSPYHQNPDRAVRESSFRARSEWFESHKDTLDRLFDELVNVRTKMAKTLGYKNFVQLGYYRMSRDCYTRDDVARFRASVKENIVPVAARLKRAQADRLGVPALKMYDDPCEYKTGNADPVGTPDDIFAHGKKMYHEMSSETAGFIDAMLEDELFDVLSRKGKSAGGYCCTLPAFKSQFIFANFNGTAGDVDVLTHEAGHAFAAYLARDVFPMTLKSPTNEGCEIHSMSMEFFAWPWMEGFFGEKTDKYRYTHLSGALTFIPYGTIVDYFQHIVYENPDMTPAQRCEKWKELEAEFRPWLDLSDTPFFGEGRRWQAQGHIFERPFYYIDYCLAQTVALQFWALAQKDREGAWERYMKYTLQAGTKPLLGLIEGAGMDSPFGAEALRTVADAASAWLDAQPPVE